VRLGTLCRRRVFEEGVLASAGSGDIVGDSGKRDSGFVGEFGEAGCVVQVDAPIESQEERCHCDDSQREIARGHGQGHRDLFLEKP
jgi:hypothetical protein